MELKVTFRNNIRILSWTIITYLGCLAFMIYKNNYIITLGMNIFFFFISIPQIILHFTYLYYNRGVYIISKDNITISTNKGSTTFSKSDIQSIKLRKPANLQDGWDVHVNGITCYYYLKITLKSGEVHYFTNLLDPYIDKIFEENGYSFYREKGIAWL